MDEIDIADPDGFAEAIRAVAGVQDPVPGRNEERDMQEAIGRSLGRADPRNLCEEDDSDELETALQQSRMTALLSEMTEEQQITLAMAESQKHSNPANNGDPGPSTRAFKGKSKATANDLETIDEDELNLGENGNESRAKVGNASQNGGSLAVPRDRRAGSSSGSDYESARGSSADKDISLPPRPAEWHTEAYTDAELPHKPRYKSGLAPYMAQLISDSEDEEQQNAGRVGAIRVPVVGTLLHETKQREMKRRVQTAARLMATPAIRPAEDTSITIDDSEEDSIQAGPGPSTTAHRMPKQKFDTVEAMKAASSAVATGNSLMRPVDTEGYLKVLNGGTSRKQLALEAEARRREKRKRANEPSGEDTDRSDLDRSARQTNAGAPQQKKKQRADDASKAGTLVEDLDGPTGAQADFQTAKKVERLPGDAFRPERGDMCWDGEVRSTWIAASRTRSNRKAWRIGDVVGDKSQLKMVIGAAFAWDDHWVQRQFPDPRQVPFIKIMSPQQGQGLISVNPDNGPLPGAVNIVPYMPNFGCMHMKFMLLFYKSGRLRIVIASANMVDYDWDSIENIAFVQDLRPINKDTDPEELSFPDHEIPRTFRKLFGKFGVSTALQHLSAMIPEMVPLPLSSLPDYRELAIWDWTKVTAQIVISEPGNFVGPQVDGVGMTRLSKIVRDKQWLHKDGEELVADFQSSSLMEFRERWSDVFHKCLKGIDPVALGILLGPIKKKKKDHKPVWPPMKVLYPSRNTVERSHLGARGGGTMFCKDKKHFRPDTKRLFYDANSLSGKNLQHTKMILVQFVFRKIAKHYIDVVESVPTPKKVPTPAPMGGGPAIEDPAAAAAEEVRETPASTPKRKEQFQDRVPINLNPTPDRFGMGGWWYMGSHNFSKAAWGQLSWTDGVPKIFCNNFEMGLVFPLARPDINEAIQRLVPWHHPPRKYSRKDVPWMQELHMPPHVAQQDGW